MAVAFAGCSEDLNEDPDPNSNPLTIFVPGFSYIRNLMIFSDFVIKQMSFIPSPVKNPVKQSLKSGSIPGNSK